MMKIKNHIMKNRVSYILGAGFVCSLLLVYRNNKLMAEYLESLGVDPVEFFTPEAA